MRRWIKILKEYSSAPQWDACIGLYRELAGQYGLDVSELETWARGEIDEDEKRKRKKFYRKLSRKVHPDKNTTTACAANFGTKKLTNCNEVSAEVNGCREILIPN